MAPTELVLGPGQIDVWCVRSDRDGTERSIAGLAALMSADEAARCARYSFERERREYVITRALCRTTLSRYAAVRPSAWTFRTNEFGRPEIDVPRCHAALHFNLSNTTGMVVCAVAAIRELGIDVESVTRFDDSIELAMRFFAAKESFDLVSLPAHAQLERVVAYWTLKEAYVKARGEGLSIPLDQFAFDIRGTDVDVHFDDSIRDDPASWHFARHAASSTHRIAVAARGAPSAGIQIRFRNIELDSMLDRGVVPPIAATLTC